MVWVENLIKGNRVSIEDVIKSMISIETGLCQSGNHDAPPWSTRHYVSTFTGNTNTQIQIIISHIPLKWISVLYCKSECVFIQGFVGLHVWAKLNSKLLKALSHPFGISLHFVYIDHERRGTQGWKRFSLHTGSAAWHTHAHNNNNNNSSSAITFLGFNPQWRYTYKYAWTKWYNGNIHTQLT